MPINGPIVPPPDAVDRGRSRGNDRSGFPCRVPLRFRGPVDESSKVMLTYTYFYGRYQDLIEATPPTTVLYPLAAHPGTINAGGHLYHRRRLRNIGFQLVDLDYRHTFYCDECTC